MPRPEHLRLLAAVGALMSALSRRRAGGRSSLSSNNYYPSKSIVPIYFEVAVLSALALYLTMVAGFNSLKLWRKD